MSQTKPHKYLPLMVPDDCDRCAICGGPPVTQEHKLGQISDEFVSAVEDHCGMGAGAWDTIDPREVILAVLAVAPRFPLP